MKLRQAFLSSTNKFFIPKLSLGNSDAQVGETYSTPITEDITKVLIRTFVFLKTAFIKLRGLFAHIFHEVGDFATERALPRVGGIAKRFSGLGYTLRYNFPKRKFLKYLVIGLVLVGLLLAAKAIISARAESSSKTEILGAKATQVLNKEITFPLKDEKGDEVSRISYAVEKAELMDEILVRGEKATAVAGRTFLILTIKIKNDFDKSIEISTKDYVRLKVAGSEELLAPDIHNDPVTVQAISTKYTRLGFPINDSDREALLQLGEINGSKETVEIKF